jgi:hypothetical protein
MNKKWILGIAVILFIICIIISVEMEPTTILTRYRHSTNLKQDPMTLRFKKDDTFTIIQFADLHYGESVEQDRNSTRVMLEILKTENQIDLAAFTGDQVSGYTRQYNRDIFLSWIDSLIPAASHGIHFVTIFGNHDDQPFHFEPSIWKECVQIILILYLAATVVMCLGDVKRFTKTNAHIFSMFFVAALLWTLYQVTPSSRMRQSILRYEKRQFPVFSHSEAGPSSLPGVSNFYLPVYSKNSVVLLFFLDSGGGRFPEEILPSQIEWVRSISLQYRSPHAIAFFHIPSIEFSAVDKFRCVGKEDTETPSTFSGRTSSPMQDLAAAGIHAVFVGHDHRNSWCCVPRTKTEKLNTLAICYGRHTGYGGYGDWARGARVIQLKFDENSLFTISTWLRMENGEQEIQGVIFPY